VTQVLRIIARNLGRLNLWIAALLLLGLLQDPQAALQSRPAPQISAQPVALLALAPKFALSKPATPDARARLMPLLDTAQSAAPIPASGVHLLHSASLLPTYHPLASHGWQARAPPRLAQHLS